MRLESWYDMLKDMTEEDGEDIATLTCTLTEAELHVLFDAQSYRGVFGKPFTAWGMRWVYFPLVYDNQEKVGHAPRHPCDIAMEHQG